MTERGIGLNPDDAERITDLIQRAISQARIDNHLTTIWNPDILTRTIPMDDDSLREFIGTFADNEQGDKLRVWVEKGKCEAFIDEERKRTCEKQAEATIDYYGTTVEDSVLVCFDDIRVTYERVMDDVARQHMTPVLTINGKEIPRPEIDS